MDYIKKLDRMDKHLAAHPCDYQTVIARLKTYSDAVEQERKHAIDARKRHLAEIRRQRGRDGK